VRNRAGCWRAAGTATAALLATLCLIWLPMHAHAQTPASDEAEHAVASPEVQQGMTLFRSSCGFCHGADAGGAQGPPLTSSPFFLVEDQGRSLADFLKTGRPASGMPPFASLAPNDITALRAFVRSRGEAAQPAMKPTAILVGDPGAGRAFFEGRGHCADCHSVSGDLKGVGARYNPVILQGRIVNPRVVGVRGRGDHDPAQVQVTMPDGTVVSGQLRQINDFFVTLVDSYGVLHTIARDNDVPRVVVHDPAEAHRQMMLHWTDRDLWNVTAYLASLK
jgi:mono/diheme cytochrome c family protein